MQNFVYPAVVYKDLDNDLYVINIEDLYLVGEGNSVEEAHEHVKGLLERYIQTTLSFGLDFVPPTKFEEIRAKYPKNLVMLVECILDDKNKIIK